MNCIASWGKAKVPVERGTATSGLFRNASRLANGFREAHPTETRMKKFRYAFDLRFLFMPVLAALAWGGVCLAPATAQAASGTWQRDEGVAARLISGVDGVGEGDTVPLGLEIQLEPGWHTYWRSPGMAGLPPQIQWKLDAAAVMGPEAANLSQATLLYPAPERFTDSGIDTVGYRERVVFPIDAKLDRPGQAVELRPSVDLLICNKICLPKRFVLGLKVPSGPASESVESGLLKEFRAKVPRNSAESGIVVRDAAVADDGVTVRVESARPFDKPELLIESDAGHVFGAPSANLSEDRKSVTFTARLTESLSQGKTLERETLTVTVLDGSRGMEQKIKLPARGEKFEGAGEVAGQGAEANAQNPDKAVVPPLPATPKAGAPLSFGIALLLALTGGFILNLMPCVLPVLSLKLLSVIGHGGNKGKSVRRSFLTTASGIVASFMALAALTIALRELGHSFGWGVQFQQPAFLAFLLVLVTIFAASLWDLITLRLPYWMSAGWSGWRERRKDAHAGGHLAGDFATGAFATLLATPCSAPFLGTAVGFALAAGPAEIGAIFMALGLGMSLPYLLVAAFPSLATALPKPGRWMIRLRHALGVALALTALWLVWVLSVQIGASRAVFIGLCMVGIVIALAMRRKDAGRRGLAFSGLAVFGVVALAAALSSPVAPASEKALENSGWSVWNEGKMRRAVAEGKTVFVDVTADWCLTCKANKRFVLSREDVRTRLLETGVVAMRADWTKPDPAIAAFLETHGRYGIPFNIVYGPNAPQGAILPELLSRDAVLEALDRAEGK